MAFAEGASAPASGRKTHPGGTGKPAPASASSLAALANAANAGSGRSSPRRCGGAGTGAVLHGLHSPTLALVELLLRVSPPRHWLDAIAAPERSELRVHGGTPSELVRELEGWRGQPEQSSIDARVVCRPLERPGVEVEGLPSHAYLVEFAFPGSTWLPGLLGLRPHVARRLRDVEGRAIAFTRGGLRAVEQWSCDGFPEVVVTLGRVR